MQRIVVFVACLVATAAVSRAEPQEQPQVFRVSVGQAGRGAGEVASIQPRYVRAMEFSPDGQFLAAGIGGKDTPGGLLIWNVAQRVPAKIIEGEGVSSVAFSSKNELVAYSHYGNAPSIMEISTGRTIASLPEAYRGPVAFSPDGTLLVCADTEHRLRFWDIDAQADKLVLDPADDAAYGRMVFSVDGSMLLAPRGRVGIHVWDWQRSKRLHELKHGSGFTRAADSSRDGRWIITGGWDGTVRIWNANSAELRLRLKIPTSVDWIDAASHSDRLAVAAGSDVHLYDLALADTSPESLARVQELLKQFEQDDIAVREAAGAELVQLGQLAEEPLRRAIAESPDAEVKIRARLAREAILTQPQVTLSHESRVSCVVFSPDDKLLASAGDDGAIRLWNVLNRKEAMRIEIVDAERP